MMKDDLLSVSRPSRYLGGEVNSIVKDLNRVRLKFALAFPDVYEVGMSHLGFQILYHILNREPEIACERVFVPWPDMEGYLRKRQMPLASLESSLPLKDFDVLGFSLQYELNYAGVLKVLELAGIPLRARDRRENAPLILGGGPCALNPEPLADFFDAFLLGDGEEAVLEICREIVPSRERGEGRSGLLRRLARIAGVYVPSFFGVDYAPDGRIAAVRPLLEGYSRVERRVLADLENGKFPTRPIVPFMEVIHDRLNIEVARGCTRGCRFCQAGMIYRPLRERSCAKIQELVEEGLKGTGYDEVSLLSLSTGDYSALEALLASIFNRNRQSRIAVSLPSLRVETLTPGLIQQIQEVRKTGFTLAPEAGTERLRRVINKGNTEEDLLRTVRTVFSAGWRLVKLYFMIGLPTETEEDLQGIVSLCREALKEARRARGGSTQINVSLSSFIPKPHTPFQWEGQSPVEEVRRKQVFLRQGLERYGLRFKWTDARMTLLEAVLARGDRRLGAVIETAHRLGSRLDAWGDHFRFALWEQAFSETGLDPAFYAHRARGLEEILPWEHLDGRVSKRFLMEEREKALKELPTADCRSGLCADCGACAGPSVPGHAIAGPAKEVPWRPARSRESTFPLRRFRARFTKLGPAKFLGHLELSQAVLRAFRRAQVPLAFSQGFHPLPKVAFGPPIPVGYESFAEYLDYSLRGKYDPEEAAGRLNDVLPGGIQILEHREIALKTPSIFDSMVEVLYLVRFPDDFGLPHEKMDRFLREEKFSVLWPRKNRVIDLKAAVASLSLADEHALNLGLRCGKDGVPKPEEALEAIFGWAERPSLKIQKLQALLKGPDPCPTKS